MDVANRYESNWVAAQREFERLQGRFPSEVSLHVNGRLTATLGWYIRSTDRIELARWLLEEQPVSEVLDTVRHEYAHALCGDEDRGHGEVWKSKCLLTGAVPAATTRSLRRPGRWVLYCPRCNVDLGRVKQRRRWAHTDCDTLLEFREAVA